MRRTYWPAAVLVAMAGCGGNANRPLESTWGLEILNAVAADKQNVVLPILSCRLEGFAEEASEYRAWSVLRREPNGRILAKAPGAGAYYPAFIFYDGEGDERIALSIDGKQVGVAEARLDDNRQRLFFSSKPWTFRGGETIELRALTETGRYRTEDLLLLRERPAARPPEYAIRNVEARAAETSATITWTTTWPVASVVEIDGRRVTEELDLNNHRVRVDRLTPNRDYRYRVSARARDGRNVTSEWQKFRTAAPPSAPGAEGRRSIPLKIEEGTLPVTAGIPFAKGLVGDPAHVRLVNGQGGEIPLQTRVLARWPDASVKWLLTDFDSRGGAASLEFGREVQRAPVKTALTVSDSEKAVTVETGRLKFTVGKGRSGLFEEVWLDGERVADQPPEFVLVDSGGSSFTGVVKPDDVVVEESGPIRATLRVAGRHEAAGGQALFRYQLRLHAWAGQPYLRIQHTFENDNIGADFTTIKSLTLRIPLRGPGKGPALEMVQLRDDRYTIKPGNRTGRQARAWAEWSDGARTVTVAVRDFWQNYPKALRVAREGLEVGLCPPLAPNEYDDAKGTIDEHRLYYYLQGGVYKLHQGVTKTHDIWLEFGRGAGAIRNEQRVRIAVAPPEWVEQSGVFGPITVPRPSPVIDQYEAAFAQAFAGYLRNRERNRQYGMLNFGDWWGERLINWGNSEYDTQRALLIQFLRTGDWRAFRTAEEMEWHNRDVDTVHHHAQARHVGAMYGHAIGHTGDYYTERPTGGAPKGGFRAGSPKSHFAVDHTFIEGHLDYYFLTGDRRSLDTALLTADRYVGYFTRNYDFNNCRQPGWHLILAMAAYHATDDPYYLNAAHLVVERVLERQTPDGGWKRQMVPGHCHCTPRHQGNAGFMVGVLLTGLRHYYEATRDERVAASIVKGAHFLVNDMWEPKVRGFRYTSCPRSTMGPWSNFLLFDGIVFAHARTGDERLKQVLIEGTAGALEAMTAAGRRDSGGWGKSFTQYTRVVPHFLEHLAGLDQRDGRGK